MVTNRTYWQEKAGVKGTIKESPAPTSIASDEILVKVKAYSMNPCDWMVADMDLPFIKYPIVLGEDVAGIVEQVGDTASSKFKVGDRVTGVAIGPTTNKPEHGAFQEYSVLHQKMACKIPDSMTLAEGSVFPLCISTAAHGLYSKDYLNLPYPKVQTPATGKSILVWGASSAVGCNAVQLAKASGYKVVATCSARNFDLVKSIGADVVFDYTSPTAVDDVVAELDKDECVGIYHAAGPAKPSIDVSAKSKQKLFVAATNPIEEGSTPEGVEAKFIFGSPGEVPYLETCPATFDGYLADALHKGAYKVAPAIEVVPTKGLEGIPEALDILRKGVSAKKLVVEAY